MNLDPASVDPQIWASPHDGTVALYLVCARRYGFGAPFRNATPRPGWVPNAWTEHPVAIGIEPVEGFKFPEGWIDAPSGLDLPIGGIDILFGERFHGAWRQLLMSDSGPTIARITRTAATIALCEAYRGIQSSGPDHETLKMKTKFNGRLVSEYKGGSTMRNIAICLRWGQWEESRVPLSMRLEELKGINPHCTEGAITSYVRKVGL